MRTWGPVFLVVVLLPAAFVALRACVPAIDARHRQPETESSSTSTACGGCHPAAIAGWRASTHSLAERPLGAEEPLSDGQVFAIDPDGLRRAFTPVRAIGVAPLWQYLVPFPGGRLQVTQAAWDPAAGEWFDVFADGRGPGEWGHWTGGGMTWNSQCASCHSTAVTKGYDAASNTYATRVLEHGVGCVACHGVQPGHDQGARSTPIPQDRWLDVCAACHALRAELTGAFAPGDRFLDHFAPSGVDLLDTFFPDGQIRTESFEYAAWTGSRMHEAGIRCLDCHDPHTGGLVRQGDALCIGCHQALPGFALHDPHPGGTVGCVGCHMPVTTYMQRDPRHDHGFPIPDPAAPAKVGPDACTRCHSDRGRAWAAGIAAQWWPDTPGPGRGRALAVAAARDGDASAVPALLAQLGSSPRAAWRATAAAALGAFPSRADARNALMVALIDPDPLVRSAAADALAPVVEDPTVASALATCLDDPVRVVRVAAGRSLRAMLADRDPRLVAYGEYLAHNADQPAVLHERAIGQLQHGRPQAAVASLERAVRADPRASALRDTLAIALSAAGRPAEAAEQLRAAVEIAPDDPSLLARLGLAEAGAGDLPAAALALDRAVAIDPSHARAWYNLGLARRQLGDIGGAVAALERAVALAPDEVDLRYGLATTLRDAGRLDDASHEAGLILQRDPAHAGARALRSR